MDGSPGHNLLVFKVNSGAQTGRVMGKWKLKVTEAKS